MNIFNAFTAWDAVVDRMRAVFLPDHIAGAAWGLATKFGLTIYKDGVPRVKLSPSGSPGPSISIYKFGKNGVTCLESWSKNDDGHWISTTGHQESLEGMVNQIELLCREVFSNE